MYLIISTCNNIRKLGCLFGLIYCIIKKVGCKQLKKNQLQSSCERPPFLSWLKEYLPILLQVNDFQRLRFIYGHQAFVG